MEALNLITKLSWEGAAAGRLCSGGVPGAWERARSEVGKSCSSLPCQALAGPFPVPGVQTHRCPLPPSWGTSPRLGPPGEKSRGGTAPAPEGWHVRCFLHVLVMFMGPYLPRGQAGTEYYPTEVVSLLDTSVVVSLLDTSSPGGHMQEGARTSSP